MLVFIPSIGEFVILELLCDPESLMIGKILLQELFSNRDLLVDSAVTIIMHALLVIPILLFHHYHKRELEE